MATSVTSNYRIHWSNDWNQDVGVFTSFSLLLLKLVLSSFPFFFPLEHSVFLVSKLMRSAPTPKLKVLWEDDDWSLMEGDDWSPTWVWHVLSVQSLLKQLNCFQLILTWSLVTKIQEKAGCFLSEWHKSFMGDDLVSCWCRHTINLWETINSDKARDALFVQRSTDSMNDSKAWMNYATVDFQSFLKFWDMQAPWYWCHNRAACHLSRTYSLFLFFCFCFIFFFSFFISATGLWAQTHTQRCGGGH